MIVSFNVIFETHKLFMVSTINNNMKYHVVLADPPWSYRDSRTTPHKRGRFNFGAEKHYNCLKLKDIKNLKVSNIAEDNAVLFLWTTFPMLKESMEIIEAWGFRYKTIGFTWVKMNQDGKPFFGVGAYAKSNAELCLMATKGNVGRLVKGKSFNPKEKLAVQSNYVSSLIMTKRPHQSVIEKLHSLKPIESYERIEMLFGNVTRVELFSRSLRDGWHSLGNEIDGKDIREVL